MPMAARSKALVCRHSLVGVAGSNPTGGTNVSAVSCQVEVSASGLSLMQRSPSECGVSECDGEALVMRRPRPNRDCCAMTKKSIECQLFFITLYTYKILL
jgi:hypothetical protein